LAGKQATCPKCKASISVPLLSDGVFGESLAEIIDSLPSPPPWTPSAKTETPQQVDPPPVAEAEKNDPLQFLNAPAKPLPPIMAELAGKTRNPPASRKTRTIIIVVAGTLVSLMFCCGFVGALSRIFGIPVHETAEGTCTYCGYHYSDDETRYEIINEPLPKTETFYIACPICGLKFAVHIRTENISENKVEKNPVSAAEQLDKLSSSLTKELSKPVSKPNHPPLKLDIQPQQKSNPEKTTVDSPVGTIELGGIPKGVRSNVAKPADPKMYYTVKKIADGNLLVTIRMTPLGDVKTTVEIGAPEDFISTGSIGFRVNDEIKNPYVEIEYVDGKVNSVKWDNRTVRAEKNNAR